jgi:dienelactone hydrolase
MSDLKEKLLAAMGPMPDTTPLEPIVVERVDCGKYVREKVEYNVEDKERISAYVCIPKIKVDRLPAIFCHHQHASNFDLGKSEVVGLGGDPDQAYASELAERGYLTLAPDAIAFEERNWSTKPGNAEYFSLATRLVQGRTLLAKVIHDVMVGIDYLASRDDVDSARIGFLGHSYGGRMALWSPIFDERIKASVSNCGCINYKDSLERDAGIQMEFCVPNIMMLGDIEDFISLIEPRALMISATSNDVWSRGAQHMFDHASRNFKNGRLMLKLYEGPHVFTAEMREQAYLFLDQYLRSPKAI